MSSEPMATAAPASPSDSQATRWYLIQCKPREDERALEHLQRQGFECYRPVRQTAKHYPSGRKYLATEALFPGYLFIRLDRVHDDWHSVHSTRGVNRIVRFKDYLPAVADELIEGIRSRLAGANGQKPYLQEGERVRIVDGAFAHLEGIFVAHDGDQRVVLLLDILQRDQRLSFPLRDVRKVD